MVVLMKYHPGLLSEGWNQEKVTNVLCSNKKTNFVYLSISFMLESSQNNTPTVKVLQESNTAATEL